MPKVDHKHFDGLAADLRLFEVRQADVSHMLIGITLQEWASTR